MASNVNLLFMSGGQATFTVSSPKNSYTYDVIKDEKGFSVYGTRGSNAFVYLGRFKTNEFKFMILQDTREFRTPIIQAILYAIKVAKDEIKCDNRVTIKNNGYCSHCSRKLKDKVSLMIGLGPRCRAKLAA